MWFRAKAKNSKKWIQKEIPFWAVARYLFWLAHIHAVKLPSTLLDPTNYLILYQIGDQPSVWTWARWKLSKSVRRYGAIATCDHNARATHPELLLGFLTYQKSFSIFYFGVIGTTATNHPEMASNGPNQLFHQEKNSKYPLKPEILNLAEIDLKMINPMSNNLICSLWRKVLLKLTIRHYKPRRHNAIRKP